VTFCTGKFVKRFLPRRPLSLVHLTAGNTAGQGGRVAARQEKAGNAQDQVKRRGAWWRQEASSAERQWPVQAGQHTLSALGGRYLRRKRVEEEE